MAPPPTVFEGCVLRSALLKEKKQQIGKQATENIIQKYNKRRATQTSGSCQMPSTTAPSNKHVSRCCCCCRWRWCCYCCRFCNKLFINICIFLCIFMNFGVILASAAPWRYPRAPRGVPKVALKVHRSILHQFWGPFWHHLGSFLAPFGCYFGGRFLHDFLMAF